MSDVQIRKTLVIDTGYGRGSTYKSVAGAVDRLSRSMARRLLRDDKLPNQRRYLMSGSTRLKARADIINKELTRLQKKVKRRITPIIERAMS